MDVKCPGCYRITTVFSHAQTVVVCAGCSCPLPAHRGQSQADRGLQLQKEAALSVTVRSGAKR